MAVDNSTFETINPSAFTTFTFPNPSPSAAASLLRVAVLDSPLQPAADPPRVAAMLVPKHRHSDWIFSTLSGHLQLLSSSPAFSRLILVGDSSPHSPPIYRRPLKDDDEELGVSLQPLFLALSPKSCFKHGIPEVPILRYQDNLISSVVLEICDGPFVGEMVVEDVEIGCGGEASKREFRRRLRFKRMPNLVQTEVRIVPKMGFGLDCVGIGQVEFRLDDSVLVHSYLVPMVASLSLAAPYIEGRIRSGARPKALCLGVGGGALLGFLRTQLGFQVEGVEADEEVLRVSRQYFGLEDGEHINVHVGDALEVIDKLAGACQVEEGCDVGSGNDVDTKFDVIMVDLDSSDARDGLIAPPLEFVRKHVLLSARSILSDHGILAVNVIPPNTSFYKTLIHTFEDVFNELYEIDVGNGENFILVAVASPLMPPSDRENCFLNRLGKAISGVYLNSIKKI
ncbi:PREDICTED: methyltransferase-like protein 13-like [Fragaria vesca subsp. vesca]|uniref:methyltransferase-like protein 13 n=1 Tax=Fragaria vesca subsp. vesca TaxID=101020 RepID=UPI0002C2EAD5|nr:PREDICTED: methyltransferase-like protein 13 [Fragaria vesca subsp. vesca]XP_011469284.1 PREDICTED: methyltransferase-like protein 13 [Fragaria vesca subsp. vesca]XP_011469285.1 PREDICTED: methyltransferase-like protein 13 [Fragaria vesca subsp. vesca]XP_011469286.1 PREDICTED: methyltransferase-like protein 13 [Fragaria vesca subsp. vesca]XP_011469287.1 PREDICTED: methyltransferase-like protein 13 [Fragaria vesca subsp. vesca]XP_011469288.1 PREDICTED: methyltransferase-like protein 13 [Frag